MALRPCLEVGPSERTDPRQLPDSSSLRYQRDLVGGVWRLSVLPAEIARGDLQQTQREDREERQQKVGGRCKQRPGSDWQDGRQPRRPERAAPNC